MILIVCVFYLECTQQLISLLMGSLGSGSVPLAVTARAHYRRVLHLPGPRGPLGPGRAGGNPRRGAAAGDTPQGTGPPAADWEQALHKVNYRMPLLAVLFWHN